LEPNDLQQAIKYAFKNDTEEYSKPIKSFYENISKEDQDELERILQAISFNKQLMLPQTVAARNLFWFKFFKNYRHSIKDILEIGSFEGSSTMYWLEMFPNAHVTCIDPFTGSPEEHLGNEFEAIFKNCESRFHHNLSPYAGRYTCFKTWSTTLLPLITSQFGLIYVDGCHEEQIVKFDTEKCWDLCRVNGLLLWDDYDAEVLGKNKRTLKYTIDPFLKTKKDQYLEVFKYTARFHSQICVQKTQ
jgi:hypothetical protein